MLSDIEDNAITKSYLTLTIGQEKYAIALSQIQEILPLERLQVVPLVPQLIRGVINVRGSLIPIIDANLRLGREKIIESAKTNVLIINFSEHACGAVLGLMVNAIGKVEVIDVTTIDPALPFGAQIRKDFIEGIVNLHGELIILLSVSHLLSLTELENLIGGDL